MDLNKYDIMLIGVNRDNYSQIEHLTQINGGAKDYLMSNQDPCAIPLYGLFLGKSNVGGSVLHILYLPEVGIKALPVREVHPLYKYNLLENTFETNEKFLLGVDKFNPALPDLSITSELSDEELIEFTNTLSNFKLRRNMPLPEPKVFNSDATLEGLMKGVRDANDRYNKHCKGTRRELYPSPETLHYYQ